jgi:tRNA pseudouridine55 synthase
VHLSDTQTIAINYGQTIPFETKGAGTVRLYHETLFLGLGEMLLDGKIAPKKLFNLNK